MPIEPQEISTGVATTEAPMSAREIAARVLRAESGAVSGVIERLGESFDRAVALMTSCEGAVIVSGIGKSGLVAKKVSATLASTGTPSHFMHATEAVHGDLGRIRRQDVVLLFSYSGTTDEVLTLATLLKPDEVPVISITRDAATAVGRLSTAALSTGEVTEACPHNLAPTASTAAMLALGDALAIAASELSGFSAGDFSRSHPGGLLGRQMLPLNDVLRFRVGEGCEPIRDDLTVRAMLARAASPGGRRAGATLLVDAAGRLTGIFTDSDLRRLLTTRGGEVLDAPVADVMTRSPRTLRGEQVVRDAVQLVREMRIDEIPIVDSVGTPIGLLDVQDLVALKVIE